MAKPNPFAAKKAPPFAKKGAAPAKKGNPFAKGAMKEGSPAEEAMDKKQGVMPAFKKGGKAK